MITTYVFQIQLILITNIATMFRAPLAIESSSYLLSHQTLNTNAAQISATIQTSPTTAFNDSLSAVENLRYLEIASIANGFILSAVLLTTGNPLLSTLCGITTFSYCANMLSDAYVNTIADEDREDDEDDRDMVLI